RVKRAKPMNSEKAMATDDATRQLPPRARIVAAARELFYRQGIRAVGVETIAEAAGTNKMTLYRHFPSKDALVAECMRQFAERADAFWAKLDTDHAGDPLGQLHAWLKAMGENVIDARERGCALANAAVELADKDHPARKVIEEFKRAQRDRLIRLCQETGLAQP